MAVHTTCEAHLQQVRHAREQLRVDRQAAEQRVPRLGHQAHDMHEPDAWQCIPRVKRTFSRCDTRASSCVLTARRQNSASLGLATRRMACTSWVHRNAHHA